MSSEVEANRSILAKPYVRYSFAVAAVAVAFLLRLVLERSFGSNFPPFLIFYPAVMVVAIVAGLWPGVLTTALSSLVVDYWVLPPRGRFALASTADAVALTLFFGMGVFISMLAQANRRNQERMAAYKSELALRQSEEQFETLANAIPQLCWMANPDGWIFWYNQRWYGYTGTTPEQMEGWGWQSVHDPETLPKVLEHWKGSIATGEPFDMVFPLRGADGVFRPFLTRVMPVKDAEGRVVRWFGTNTDISAQKQAEEDSKNSFVTLSNFVPQLVWMCTPDGLNIYFNQRWVDYTGLTLEESYGRGWNTPFHPDDQQPAWDAWNKAVQTGGQYSIECRLRAADGSYRRFLIRGEPMPDTSGGVLRWLGTCTDIEDLRQESEHLLRTVTENSRVGLVMLSADRRYLYANAAYSEVLGLSTPDIVGKHVPDVMGHVYDQISPRLDRAFAGERVNYELKVPVPQGAGDEGRDRFYAITYEPLLGHGEDIRVIVVVVDITERKQAEEARARLAAIVESSGDAIISKNLDGIVSSWNQSAERLFGYSAEEIIGLPITLIIPPDRDGEEAAFLERLRRGGDVDHYETVRRDKSGRRIDVSVTLSPIRDTSGAVIGVSKTARDITARKQAEAALRESEQRWAITLQSIGDAVISTDATGNIVFMNDVAQRLTGWSLPEVKGSDLSTVFDIVQEVTRVKPESPVAKVIRLGKVVGLANHTALIRRDGTEIPIEDSGAPIRNREGQIEGVVLVFRDVSEQRKVEKALRNSDRLATTGRLAATLAHEIHNPLDAVGGLLYLIGQSTQEETTREYVSMASQELVRTTQMTQQMLAFQREAAQPLPVKIGEILDNVIALYDKKITSAGINLKRQVDFDGHILALPGELRQMFANLVGNAIEAVGSRRGTITLRAYASRDWRHDQPGLRVVVADDGPGIPATFRTSIFEPFFTTKGESGTGLGLWIASDILRKYDGTMRLRTSTRAPHSGTCFSVFFPFEIRPSADLQTTNNRDDLATK